MSNDVPLNMPAVLAEVPVRAVRTSAPDAPAEVRIRRPTAEPEPSPAPPGPTPPPAPAPAPPPTPPPLGPDLMTGSRFIEYTRPMPKIPNRENEIEAELKKGNMPSWLKDN